jgi:hypothetical protein
MAAVQAKTDFVESVVVVQEGVDSGSVAMTEENRDQGVENSAEGATEGLENGGFTGDDLDC